MALRLYKFILPMPPTRGNARGMSRFANSHRDKYWALCDIAMHDLGFYPFRDEPLQKAKWHAEFVVAHPMHLMDFDNLVAKLKWPFDYLQARNIIVNDSHDKFWPYQLPLQSVAKKQTPTLHLTLTEVENVK